MNIAAPDRPNTVFADVTWQTAGALPYDPKPASGADKLALGLGVTGAIVAVVAVAAMIWWARRRRKYEAEVSMSLRKVTDHQLLAFNRLPTADKASFLEDNPDSWLNPARQRARFIPGRSADVGPPAPPGTMAYAQWYWSQVRRQQQQGGQQYQGYGPVGFQQSIPQQDPMTSGFGQPIMSSMPGQMPWYGYQSGFVPGMGVGPPVPPKW